MLEMLTIPLQVPERQHIANGYCSNVDIWAGPIAGLSCLAWSGLFVTSILLQMGCTWAIGNTDTNILHKQLKYSCFIL